MSRDRIEIASDSKVRPAPIRLDTDRRQRIASSLREAYDIALSNRSGIDWRITEAERNYEMETIPRVYPWKNAANVFLPIIPEQLDTIVSGVIGEVFVPRFFLVIGNTNEAAVASHKVQRFYNAELTRPRSIGADTWLEEAYTWVHLAGLHGTGYLDVTWLRKKSKQKYMVLVDDVDDETGLPVLDFDKAESKQRWETHEVEFTDYDDVLWEPVELRDVILVPAHAKSVEAADAVVRIMHYTENDLRAMVRSGLMWADAVEQVINGAVAKGDTERTNDPRGVETYEIGGLVNVSAATTNSVDDTLKTTEYEVLRIDSRQFDVNGDGVAEHMIYFLHRDPEYLLGAVPFPYHHGRRTLIPLSLLKRPNRAYGWGIPERLGPIQTEANAIENQMLDQTTLRLSPPRRQESSVKVLGGEDGDWGPSTVYIGPKDSVGLIDLGDIIPSAQGHLELLLSMAGRIAGQSSLATGALAKGRKTKAEVMQAARGQNVRASFYANSVRLAMSKVFWLTHWLKIQYAPDNIAVNVPGFGGRPERLEISKEELSQDFDLLVAGMGGPLDREGDRQDSMLLHQMFTQRPDIQGDPMRLYAFDRMVLDAFQRPDTELLIGTAQEAQQRTQRMQQQRMLQAAMAQQGMPPGGQPQQRPQQRPGRPQGGDGGMLGAATRLGR